LRRWMLPALLGAMAFVPGLVFAQGAQGGQQDEQFGTTIQMSDQRPTSFQGVAKGTVLGLNLSDGIVTISTPGGRMHLRGMPGQIADLNPGDLVAFTYNNYNGVLWLSLDQGAGGGIGGAGNLSLSPESFGSYGMTTGYVNRVDKRQGFIEVRGVQFRTHPQLLQNVIPGQFVNVTFAEIGNRNWADQITLVDSGTNFDLGSIGGQQGPMP
jgi:hypothetical protein